MNTDLVAIPQTTAMLETPSEVVDRASQQARLLMDIVEKTGCYQQIRDKKYLQVEAWETIGAFNRTHAETEFITAIVQDDQTIGYQAKVQLFKDGMVTGGAIMPCYFTENACRGKEGDAKHKASMSAAQTFATSKAYRMNFSYVAILAGYSPTPAEEMTGEDSTVPDYTKHWCKEHKTAYFKKGNMKSYAHPITDAQGNKTGDWCNEPEPKKEAPTEKEPTAAAKPEPKPEATEAVLHPTEGEGEAQAEITEAKASPIDMEWLGSQLKIVQSKKMASWRNTEVVKQIAAITGKEADSVTQAVANLNHEQAELFVKKLESAVEVALA